MGAWVPILLVIGGCLLVVLIVVILQMGAANKAQMAAMEKRLKAMEARIRQHDEEIAHLRDQIQHQEPVNPLAAFVTSAAAAITGMKVGKAMLPALGLAAIKTLTGHVLPLIGKGRGQKALPKK